MGLAEKLKGYSNLHVAGYLNTVLVELYRSQVHYDRATSDFDRETIQHSIDANLNDFKTVYAEYFDRGLHLIKPTHLDEESGHSNISVSGHGNS